MTLDGQKCIGSRGNFDFLLASPVSFLVGICQGTLDVLPPALPCCLPVISSSTPSSNSRWLPHSLCLWEACSEKVSGEAGRKLQVQGQQEGKWLLLGRVGSKGVQDRKSMWSAWEVQRCSFKHHWLWSPKDGWLSFLHPCSGYIRNP